MQLPVKLNSTQSEFVQAVLHLNGLPFRLTDREYLVPIYDGDYQRILLMTGRQVEKSTTLAAKLLAEMLTQPFTQGLYIAPSSKQTRTFSSQKLTPFVHYSPIIKNFYMDSSSVDRVMEKTFLNGSRLLLDYVFLDADRVRGNSADILAIDELQDVLSDNIPVIEECLSHSTRKRKIYSGTPKAETNILYESWRSSTQTEWLVKCEHCGKWNRLDERNIKKEGLSCSHCGGLLDPKKGLWVDTSEQDNPYFKGFRIPQVMASFADWDDIWRKYTERYSPQRFYNEVLGLPYSESSHAFTIDDIKRACDEPFHMLRGRPEASFMKDPLFAGIDWATSSGDSSHTFLSIGGFDKNNKFRVVFQRRYDGIMADTEDQYNDIVRQIVAFNVGFVGVDWGIGSGGQNSRLRRAFMNSRARDIVAEFHLVGSSRYPLRWDPVNYKYIVNRTQLMKKLIEEVKTGQVRYPAWSESATYLQEFLNITVEYSEARRETYYDHETGRPDDGFFSLLFLYLMAHIHTGKLRPVGPDQPNN